MKKELSKSCITDTEYEKNQIKLQHLLDQQYKYLQDLNNTLLGKKLHDVRSDLYNHIRDIGKNGSLSLILEEERCLTERDFLRYGNNKATIKSFKEALANLDTIKEHITLVNDPAQYQLIDRSYSLPKNRRGRLPYDGARKAIALHYKWLEDTETSFLTQIELSINEARKDNMKILQKLYEQAQAKAIGIDLA